MMLMTMTVMNVVFKAVKEEEGIALVMAHSWRLSEVVEKNCRSICSG
jgi:hypothetical protein